MLHHSSFDDIASIVSGITITNPAMVSRIRRQAEQLTDREVAAHLVASIANATDAAHAFSWEEAQLGGASAETLVDHEYFEDLVAAWSLLASERSIETLDVASTIRTEESMPKAS